MTHLCTRFGGAFLLALVEDTERGRLLDDIGAPISLDNRFTPAAPLLQPFCVTPTALMLGEGNERFGG